MSEVCNRVKKASCGQLSTVHLDAEWLREKKKSDFKAAAHPVYNMNLDSFQLKGKNVCLLMGLISAYGVTA